MSTTSPLLPTAYMSDPVAFHAELLRFLRESDWVGA